MTTVRKQKSGDQLTVGDWLAPDQVTDGAAEVLFAHAYPASADGSRDNDGKHVQLSVREQGKLVPVGMTVAGTTLFDLASDEDLAALRATVERTQRIADVRALINFLEANPGLPIPRFYFQESPDPHGDVWNSGAEGLATVTRWAEIMGVKVVELEEQHSAARRFGTAEYCVIAWHKDGRLDEPDPDPTGQLYSRADDADDPTPVSPARVPLHTGAVVDGGQLVDETGCTHGVTTCRCADADEVPAVECSPACRDLYRPDRGVHFLGCPNFATPMAAADIVPVPAEDATVTPLPESVPAEDAGGGCPPGGCRPNFCVGADDCRRDEDVDSEEQERGIDPDSSMEAHYDAEAETGVFSPARRQALLWKRAVNERGGVAEALEHAHEVALFEDNDRARCDVVLGLRPGEFNRIANPGLARFLAEKEHAKRFPTHLVFLLGDTACGIEPEEIPESDRRTSDADAVTCRACRRALKPSPKDVYA